ncbi:MAG: hypothetical protein R3300_15995 [Candidatus Promineifilaceae bacterium]|nr:hypothetical protein [Candidatus Promineifilaceae bacterium]
METAADVTQQPDGAILPSTRVVAAIIIPFLLAATAILFFVGQDNLEQRFAWGISPALTAAYGGAGYFGGAYFFSRVLLGRRWRRVAAGFLPVAAFTAAMLVTTLLHWSRFDPGHFPFQVWLILYIATPVLVPLIWWRNQRLAAPTGPAADVLPGSVRWSMGLLGGLVTVAALLVLVSPELASDNWPWTLSQLTARFMAGWHLLLGVGGLVLARQRRWAAWRVPAQSILIWQGLVLINMVIHRGDFTSASLLNWYTGFVAAAVLGVAALYLYMERDGAAAHA